jgi:tetratricopeptide (TPR) repeat protein
MSGLPQPGIHVVEADLCGRDAELKALTEVLERALQYQAPQLVTVSGAAGVGKSRLVSEWLKSVRARADGVRVFSASAPERGGDHAIFGGLLRERFGVPEGDESEPVIEKFKQQVTEVFADRRVTEVAHFLGSYMGLKLRDNPFLRVMEQQPLQRDQIARSVLCRFLEADAARSPMVLVFEDLQRADQKSLTALRELAETLTAAPVVMVAVTRPDLFVRLPGWNQSSGDQVHVEVRPLNTLDAERLMRSLLRKVERLPQDLLEDIVGMTGGNPFFSCQLVRALLAQGIITVERDRWIMDAGRARTVQLPMSVDEAVAARIAALEARERDLLEKAAALGSVFWTGALVVLSRLNREVGEEEVHDDLRKETEQVLQDMVERDYLLHMPDSSLPHEDEFVFKHNLEREFVIKSTAPERARRYRLFAAQWLETRVLERTEETFEYLATLYEQGGNTRRGAYYYITAADRARSRHSNAVAARLYEQGLGLLEYDDALSKIEALHNYGDVLVSLGRTAEALERFAEMLRHAWLLDYQSKAGAAHSRIGRIYRQLADYPKASQHLNLALQLFSKADDKRGVASTLDDIGKLNFLRGDTTQVLDLMRKALVLRRQLGDRRSIAVSLGNIGRVLQSTGDFPAALETLSEALTLFREAPDQQGEVSTLLSLGQIQATLGENGQAATLFKQALDVANEIGDRLAQATLLAAMADAQKALGQTLAASECVSQAAEVATALGDKRLQAECNRKLGEMLLSRGDVSGAREKCDLAVEIAGKLGSRVELALAQRALATVLMHPSYGEVKGPEAERLLDEAVRGLKEAHDEPELARTYEVQARVLESTGEVSRAHRLLEDADAIHEHLKGKGPSAPAGAEIDIDLSDF